MRNYLLILLTTVSVYADSSDEPGSHFFVVPSPANKYHIVHTVRTWSNVDMNHRFGRLQLFDTESGRELWRLEGVLVDRDEVFPLDNGTHMFLLNNSLRGVGKEVDRKQPIISFYATGKLIKSYTLEELEISSESLEQSVSHSLLYSFRMATAGWSWEFPLSSETAQANIEGDVNPNPYVREGVFEIKTVSGHKLRFDCTTGLLLTGQDKK